MPRFPFPGRSIRKGKARSDIRFLRAGFRSESRLDGDTSRDSHYRSPVIRVTAPSRDTRYKASLASAAHEGLPLPSNILTREAVIWVPNFLQMILIRALDNRRHPLIYRDISARSYSAIDRDRIRLWPPSPAAFSFPPKVQLCPAPAAQDLFYSPKAGPWAAADPTNSLSYDPTVVAIGSGLLTMCSHDSAVSRCSTNPLRSASP